MTFVAFAFISRLSVAPLKRTKTASRNNQYYEDNLINHFRIHAWEVHTILGAGSIYEFECNLSDRGYEHRLP